MLVLGRADASQRQPGASLSSIGPPDTPTIVPAGFSLAQSAGEVKITYIDHSTFRLRTPSAVVIATDYAGYAGDGPVPTLVTMNHAHETHYTDFPDPAIEHVLRGWNPKGGPAEHRVTVRDTLVRNVSTDIRTWSDDVIEKDGNSIFIFEVADLCIGHLGHLHHKPSPQQLARIGRLDVVFAPVDGTYTLDLPSMIEVLKALRASLVIRCIISPAIRWKDSWPACAKNSRSGRRRKRPPSSRSRPCRTAPRFWCCRVSDGSQTATTLIPITPAPKRTFR